MDRSRRRPPSLPLPEPPALQPRQGRLDYHHDFGSEFLGNRRSLVVYLPPGYDESAERYPVVYFHDGQNVFEPATAAFGVAWHADLAAERLLREGRLPPLLMVGVYNTPARHDEYTPHRDPGRDEGGRAADYGRFLFWEVKPFIDGMYRTRPHRDTTAVVGSSLGGLASLALAWHGHQHFALCGALSPSLWWAEGAVLSALAEGDLTWMRTMRFWVDMGTRETERRRPLHAGIVRLRHLRALFDQAGLAPGRHYYYQEVVEGEHNEANWAARVGDVLLYLFS